MVLVVRVRVEPPVIFREHRAGGSDTHQEALAVAAGVRGLLLAGFQNGIAPRGALTVGDLDEIDLADDALNASDWNARFAGLLGHALVDAYELEGRSQWSGAILHRDLVAHLDAAVLGEHEDGPFTALDSFSSSQLVVETLAPMKERAADGQAGVSYTSTWVINWPLLAQSVDWSISEQAVADSFTSYD